MMYDVQRLRSLVEPSVENLIVLSRTGSTHDLAVGLLEQAAEDDVAVPSTLILAESQDGGHGRSGRPWISPPGGLYLSLVEPGLSAEQLAALPMVAAAAAATLLRGTGADTVIRWPNDLLAGGRKIGGLIFHGRGNGGLLGITSLGLNVASTPALPHDRQRAAVSLADILGTGAALPGLTDLAASFVNGLLQALADPGAAVDSWRCLLVHRPGDVLTVHLADGTTLTGAFAGVTGEGYLRLITADGDRVLTTGDVGLLGQDGPAMA